MFSGIPEAASAVHSQLLTMYWILLAPVIVTVIVLQFLKGKQEVLDGSETMRRVVISILLLLSIKFVFLGLAELSDLITNTLSQNNSLADFMKKLGPAAIEGTEDRWFDFKKTAIYVLSLLCYLIAYLGFFVSEAIVHFVWAVLYALSPLMILCFVSEKSAKVTSSLYKGMMTVCTWRIVYACLGAFLMNMELDQGATGLDDWLLSAVLNICIGLSMLLVPMFTKSLISDGLSSASSSLAAGMTYMAGGFAKVAAAKGLMKGAQAAAYSAKPLTNRMVGHREVLAHNLNRRFNVNKRVKAAKNKWENALVPNSAKKLREKKERAKSMRDAASRKRRAERLDDRIANHLIPRALENHNKNNKKENNDKTTWY